MIPDLLLAEIPIEKTLISSPIITILVTASFILSSIAMAFGKRTLIQNARNFFQTRERNSIFDASTNIDWWVGLILVTQLCIMFSINAIAYFGLTPENSQNLIKLILLYFLCAVAYISLKFLLYRFFGWIFYEKSIYRQWISSYKTILFYNSFILFFIGLLSIYFNLSFATLQLLLLILVIIDKILAFYKWIKLFFNSKVGYVLFILQFCALEIVPCFLVYQGLIELNTLLK